MVAGGVEGAVQMDGPSATESSTKADGGGRVTIGPFRGNGAAHEPTEAEEGSTGGKEKEGGRREDREQKRYVH